MAVKPPDLRNRSPKVTVLPDLRLQVERIYDLLNEPSKIPTGSGNQPGLSDYLLPWGTADVTYTACRLTQQRVTGQFDENGNVPDDPTVKPPLLVRTYETIDPVNETPVGQADTTIDQDGLTEVTQGAIQFSVTVAGVILSFLVPGTSSVVAENGVTCYLKDESRTDDGTIQRITRHYISKGTISNTTETKYNGALSLQTIVSINQVPATPSGYTLVVAKVDHPGGNPLYTYTFAKGLGEIGRTVEYRLSPDQGATGVTVTTIKYLAAPGTASNPITGPVGSNLISVDDQLQDGYMLWTAIYAQGQGTIATTQEFRDGGKLVITTITAINAAPSAPAAVIGGTPTLFRKDTRNGTRFEDGTIIYEYAWAEANGQIAIQTRGEPDGAIIYTVAIVTNTLPVAAPGYPGSGTGYCIDWNWEPGEGFYTNRAIWKKPPATDTYKKHQNFRMPGQVEPTSPNPGFIFLPSTEQDLLVDVTVSYGTSQITTKPFSVLQWAGMSYTFTPTSTGVPVTGQKGLGGYLSGGTTASGSGTYNGVPVSSWSETILGSTPSAPPSGLTTISVENEPYLVDITGTKVYRSIVATYTF